MWEVIVQTVVQCMVAIIISDVMLSVVQFVVGSRFLVIVTLSFLKSKLDKNTKLMYNGGINYEKEK